MSTRIGRRRFFRSGLFLALVTGGTLASVFSFLTLTPSKNFTTSSAERPSRLGLVQLPRPTLGKVSVEEALVRRRSVRDYGDVPVSLEAAATILWSTQGVTEPEKWVGLRTIPSAGGLYPLEVYAVVREGGVEGLEAGAYHYEPHSHTLEVIARGDYSHELMAAAVDQPWVASAAFNIVITAVPQRTVAKYGDRSWQYIWQESGHAGQNVYLEATALNLGNTVIGAFYENEVRSILRIPQEELPVYIATVGTLKV